MGRLSYTSNSDALRICYKLMIWLVSVYVINVIGYFALSRIYIHLSGGISGAHISQSIQQKADVFIFGASRASHHYRPDILKRATDRSVYNAADDGKSTTYQLGLLTLLIKRHKPQYILYEVGDIMQLLEHGNTDLRPYYYRDSTIRSLLNRGDSWGPLKYAFKMYSYNQSMLTNLRMILRNSKAMDDGYRPLYGEVGEKEVVGSRVGLEGPDSNFVKQDSDRTLILNFVEFLSKCEENGISVIFLFSPSLTGFSPPYSELIQSIAKEKGIPYLDYSEDKRFEGNRRLFRDVNHLNDEGARILSSDVGEKVNVIISHQRELESGGYAESVVPAAVANGASKSDR